LGAETASHRVRHLIRGRAEDFAVAFRIRGAIRIAD
jgi:hypothetical protein